MKIKLAILDQDKDYLNNIISFLSTKYSDKLELYSFTSLSIALSVINETKIDVFIANDSFEIDVQYLPKRCGFAYFVTSRDISSVNGQRAISKFQKIDLIYKQILSIYSEKSDTKEFIMGDDHTKIIAFSSPCGGCGTSTMAAACSVYFAKQGKKSLYLNLEKFGSSDIFFSGEGQFDMSDVIYALKNKKGVLSIKLESCVKKDKSNVSFYSSPKQALDMLELSTEEIIRLINELKLMGSFDYIILDTDFDLNSDMIKILNMAHTIAWVGDGSKSSNEKINRTYQALRIFEQHSEMPIFNRLSLIYNKFSTKSGSSKLENGLRSIDGAPTFVHATTHDVIEQLSSKDFFSALIQ